jgi:ABC-type Na+ efflux pump permease subunit
MNAKIISIIAKKDMKDAFQNKSVVMPILVVPTFFVFIIPLAMIFTATNPGMSSSLASQSEMETMLNALPPFMTHLVSGLDASQVFVVMILGYFFAPFFLILPLMYSNVIASESFAGERERKTIEALLYTPASDAELFFGKILAALIPAVAITWGSFLAYTILLNTAAYHIMGELWFPLAQWYPLIFWVSPAISLLGIAFTVLISTKTQTFMGAYQTSASLVVLVLGLLVGQITGILYMDVVVGLVLGLVIWVADILLTVTAIKTFKREKLLMSN